ncbi:hypothetical protein JD844_017432 [Phrynosoma platyrhinos]|uniref:Sushi domain-containing protein n=1 Tax=Phrynosoma platyrhinos TaxID=52577 RepID=A0ABQ7SLW1_PHRPL|nr:hypothetical protein JD844_017432 [Phrynosoma platyrhinos]
MYVLHQRIAQNDCGPPPRRDREELADLSVKESYSHNEQVLYNCRPGYIKLGRFRMRCNNGRWVQMAPFIECKRKPCGHPGDIQFGSFELVEGEDFSFGARVVYQCDEGTQGDSSDLEVIQKMQKMVNATNFTYQPKEQKAMRFIMYMGWKCKIKNLTQSLSMAFVHKCDGLYDVMEGCY